MQSMLDQAINRMQYEFTRSPEMTDATAAEKQAWNDYVHARNNALKGVMNDPNYKVNVALKTDLGEKIAEVRASSLETCGPDHAKRVTPDASVMRQIVDMATVKL